MSARPTTVLETARLDVRPLTHDDAEFILRLLNDPSFLRNIGDKGVRTLDDARRYLDEGPIASYAAHGFGLWRVATKSDDVPVGMCGLLRRPELDDVDVGYALLPEYGSKGYALEVAHAVLRHARERLGLARIVAVVKPGNARSIRLLERLGFRYERLVRLAGDEDEVELWGSEG